MKFISFLRLRTFLLQACQSFFVLFLIQWHVTLTSINHWKKLPSEFVHSHFLTSLNADWMDFWNTPFIKISNFAYGGVIRWRLVSVPRSRNQITWPFWHKLTYLIPSKSLAKSWRKAESLIYHTHCIVVASTLTRETQNKGYVVRGLWWLGKCCWSRIRLINLLKMQ